MILVVQLTDTDFAFLFKRCLELRKHDIVKMRKEEATSKGETFQMKFGPREILFIVSRAFADLKIRSEREQLGLHGLRRNGQLMSGPCNGKIKELIVENFPWLGLKEFGVGWLG